VIAVGADIALVTAKSFAALEEQPLLATKLMLAIAELGYTTEKAKSDVLRIFVAFPGLPAVVITDPVGPVIR
jgi:hypothetical protein